MRNRILLTSTLTALLFFIFSTVQAGHLEGLWENDRNNITLQIEEENAGIRAKRSDEATWYRYQRQNADVYTDRNGNRFTVINDDQIEWRERNTNARMVFHRVNTRDKDRWNEGTNRFPPRGRENDRWDDEGISDASLTGRWYDRSNKERIQIEAIDGGYRVRTEKGQWEKYTMGKNDRLRSRSGNIIRMIDRNTLEMRSNRERDERIFVRQGNGKQHESHGKGKGNVNENRNGHGKANGHAKGRGKKSCG